MKTPRLLWKILSVIASLLVVPMAQSQQGADTNLPPIKVFVFAEKQGNETSEQCRIEGKANRFGFALPSGFAAQFDAKTEKIWVTKPGVTHRLTVEIWERLPATSEPDTKEIRMEKMKRKIQAEYPTGQIVKETETTVAERLVPLLEVKWVKNEAAFGARFILVPFPTADVLFTLTGPMSQEELSEAAGNLLTEILISFYRKNLDEGWVKPRAPVVPD